jgi:hypothetical protein
MALNPANREGYHSHFHLLQDLEHHFPYAPLVSGVYSQVKNFVDQLIPWIIANLKKFPFLWNPKVHYMFKKAIQWTLYPVHPYSHVIFL